MPARRRPLECPVRSERSVLSPGSAVVTDSVDEMFDHTGAVRETYRPILPAIQALTHERRKAALRASKKKFRGDNVLDPVPRLLPESTYASLKAGVVQRGTALRMFLADHYSGAKTYREVVPGERVDAIIARNRQAGYEGLLAPDRIAFPYGPDIMRDEHGRFYIIEDNTGYIGGPGDLITARETLFSVVPEYKTLLRPVDRPEEYFTALVERARRQAIPSDGKIIMFMSEPFPDHEDDRLWDLMKNEGVEVVTNKTRARLVTTDEGVFVRKRKGEKETFARVGYVFLNGEHRWVDASHPATRAEYLLTEADDALHQDELSEEARARLAAATAPEPGTGEVNLDHLEAELLSTGVLTRRDLKDSECARGLVQALLDGKVAANYSPGVDFVGDKEFKGYVDDLVRHYLGEEPTLTGIPVHRFTRAGDEGGEGAQVDEDQLHRLFDDGAYKDYVFKVVNGRGGDGVHIGPKLSDDVVPAIKDKIRAEPSMYVAEPYKRLSTLDGHIVDLRLIATVDPEGVEVSPTPWGRGVPTHGNGLVNLGQNGKQFGVAIVRDPPASSTGARSEARV